MRYVTGVEEIENYGVMEILYFADEINKFDISFFCLFECVLEKNHAVEFVSRIIFKIV